MTTYDWWGSNFYFSERFYLPTYTLVILLLVSYIAISGGASQSYPVFGQYIPESYCNGVINGTASNFTSMQSELMMPKDENSPSQHNCILNEKYRNHSCESYTYDTSIMKETSAVSIVSPSYLGRFQQVVVNSIASYQGSVLW